jgi:hypothetical protein
VSLYPTWSKGITILKHMWTNFEQSVSTLSLCSKTEATNA